MTIHDYEQKVKAMSDAELMNEHARTYAQQWNGKKYAINQHDICEWERKRRVVRISKGVVR